MGQTNECNLKVGNLCLDNSHIRDICQTIINNSDHLSGSTLNPHAKQVDSNKVALTCFSKCEDDAYHIIEADVSEPWLANLFKKFEPQKNTQTLSTHNIEISYLTNNEYVKKVHDLFGPKAFLPEIKQAGFGIGIGVAIVSIVLFLVACGSEDPEPILSQHETNYPSYDAAIPSLPEYGDAGDAHSESDSSVNIDTTQGIDSIAPDVQTYPEEISEPDDTSDTSSADASPEVTTDTLPTDAASQDSTFEVSDSTGVDAVADTTIEDTSEEVTGDTVPTDTETEETSDTSSIDVGPDVIPIEESENFCYDPFEPGSCMTSGNVSQEIKDAMSLCPTVAKVTIDGEEMSLADALILESGNPFLLSSSEISIQFYFDNIHPNDINNDDEFSLTPNPIMFEDGAFGEWIGMMGGIEYFTMWSLDDNTLILNKNIPTSATTACSMGWYFPCESDFVCE